MSSLRITFVLLLFYFFLILNLGVADRPEKNYFQEKEIHQSVIPNPNLKNPSTCSEVKVATSAGMQITFKGAKVTIPSGALTQKIEIQIEKLGKEDLPSLANDMINVTEGDGGFRFLPPGTTFKVPVKVEIPIKKEFSSNFTGVRTYYWNEQLKQWYNLKKLKSVNKNLIVSETNHFTIMINAILSRPDNPPPLLFNPNSIKDISAVVPTSGIDFIEPPEANSKGTAEISYPIHLPKGRGAYSPQLILSYSSERGNGYMGIGWDLPIPRIEVDTRWGVPNYKKGNLRYLLNGVAIVPIDKDPNVTCKTKEDFKVLQQFAPRNETFERIIFCKNTLNEETYWEVTNKDGTRFEYGTDKTSRLTSYNDDENANTAVWFISRVVDANGNQTKYEYEEDNDKSISDYKGEPFIQKYLTGIEYTLHENQTIPATYRVDVQYFKDGPTDPKNIIVNCRTGFKVVTRRLLKNIDVYFIPNNLQPNQLISRYSLEYKEGGSTNEYGGDFGKIILSKIIAEGSDGSELYYHSFCYSKAEGNSPSGKIFSKETSLWKIPQQSIPECHPLDQSDQLLNNTSEESHTFGGSVGASFRLQVGTLGAGCSAGINGRGTWETPNPNVEYLDINGDNIADRIWLQDGNVKALFGKQENGKFSFNPSNGIIPYEIIGLKHIGTEDAKGGMMGLSASCEAQAGAVKVGVGVGLSFSEREVDNNSLLTDVDGDGIVDLAFGQYFYRGTPFHTGEQNLLFEFDQGLSNCSNVFKRSDLRIGKLPSTVSPLIIARRDKVERINIFTPLKYNLEMDNSSTDINDTNFMNNFELGFSPLNNFASLSNVNRMTRSFDLKVTSYYSNHLSKKEILPQTTPKINLGWDRYTAKRMRLEKEPHIKEKMYRLNPIIRWDARHSGTIELKALAHRKFIGGKDGVKIVILHVTNPTISSGTNILGTTYLLPNDTSWVEISGSGKVNIEFEEALLFVIDTIDDVPIDASGNLVDEVELDVEIKYTSVILPGQPPRMLNNEDLKHVDATGQLAYYYHFPTDLSISELPRDNYWQIIPPIGPARVNADNSVDYNRIVGIISKVEKTPTPVHVRIRCESLGSQEANDDSIYSLGSILFEKVFSPEEINEQHLDIDLPSPWIAQSNPINSKSLIAIVSNKLKLNSLDELNKREITIGVPTESIESIVREYFPKASVKNLLMDRGIYYTEHHFARLFRDGPLDAFIETLEDALERFSRERPEIPGRPNQLTVPEVAYIWPSISNPISIFDKRQTFLYKPLRLLFEVDGENGFEVPPTAINWKPVIEIVSIYDMEEVREPLENTIVALVSRNREIGKNALKYQDLNKLEAGITYGSAPPIPNKVSELIIRYFPNASIIPYLPFLWGDMFPYDDPLYQQILDETGELGVAIYNLAYGYADALLGEYGEIKKTISKLDKIFALDIKENTFFLGSNGFPNPIYGSIRALVRDEIITGNNQEPIKLYDYNDLDRPEITIAYVAGSDAEMSVKHWNKVQRISNYNNDEALKEVMNGKANVLIADKEFLEEAITRPEISSKSFIGFKRGNPYDINTEVAHIRRTEPVTFKPRDTWHEFPKVLYRVHPARQLKPFFSPDEHGKLKVTLEGINLRKTLFITVTGENIEGEVAHWQIEPNDEKWIHSPTGNKVFYESYTIELPKPGLYYVRGYSEAGFDKTTEINLKAELLDVESKPQIALTKKDNGKNIQNYSDLNKAEISIVYEKKSPAENIIKKYFPLAASHGADSKEIALNWLLGGDFVAMIADAGYIQSLINIQAVKDVAFVCCPPNAALVLLPDINVSTNLLNAKFGGGHRGQHLTIDARKKMNTLEINVVGEIPYSQDPWGGGHHGFFYGEVRGDAILQCIGSVYCDDLYSSTGYKTSDSVLRKSNSSLFSSRKSKLLASLSVSTEIFSQRKNSDYENCSESLDFYSGENSQNQMLDSCLKNLSILLISNFAKDTNEIINKIERSSIGDFYLGKYSDFDNLGLIVWVPKETFAEMIAQHYFNFSQVRSFKPSQIEELLSNINNEKKFQAIIANTEYLNEFIKTNSDLQGKIRLLHFKEGFYSESYLRSRRTTVPISHYQILDSAFVRDIVFDIDPYPDPKSDLDGDGVFDSDDDCPFAAGELGANGCPIGEESSIKKPPCSDINNIDLSPDGCLWKYLNAFFPMEGNYFNGEQVFTGPDPTSYVSEGGTHSTQNNSLPGNGKSHHNGDSDGNGGGIIDGALRRSQNFGLNVAAGVYVSGGGISFGVNANIGIGTTYGELEYMDWNGDGLPDINSPNVIYLTGCNEDTVSLNLDCYQYDPFDFEPDPLKRKCFKYPGIRESRNSTMGLAMSLGPAVQFQHKTTPEGRAKELSWDKIEGGIGIHAQTSMSTTSLDRFDINGDGLPDIVMCEEIDNINRLKVRLNLGYRIGEEEDWGAIDEIRNIGSKLDEQFNKSFNQAAFSDALSRTDNITLGTSVGASGGFEIAIFGGGGGFGKSDDITLAQTPILITDLNGDGLPDIVKKNPNEPKLNIRFNAGGNIGKSHPFQSNEQLYMVPNWESNPRMIGSTLLDFLTGAAKWVAGISDESPDALLVSGGNTSTYAGTVHGTFLFVTVSHSYHHTGGNSFVELSLKDVTGDGLPDRILRSGDEHDGGIQVQKNLLGGANLLQTIHRPLGGKIVIKYEPTISTVDDPHTRWVMTDCILEPEESYPIEGKTSEISETFEYINPYYDRFEREFYGFEIVNTIHKDGSTESITYANRDYRLKGLILKSEILDNDKNLFTRVENEYEPEHRYADRTQTERQLALGNLKYPLKRLSDIDHDIKGLTPCDVWFAKPTKTVTEWFDGGTDSKQTTQYYEEYDSFGNIIKIRDEQDEGSEDDLVALIDYDHNISTGEIPTVHQQALLNAYIANRVKSIKVWQESMSGTLLQYRRGSYDDKGNILKQEIFADLDGKKIATLDFEYDSKGTGFITAITDAVGYRVEYTPDKWHILTKESKDSFGLFSTTDYDYRFQLPIEQTDVNKQKQTTKYDVHGRLSEMQGPYELAQGVPSLKVDYADPMKIFPTYAITTNIAVIPGTNTNSTAIRTTIFMDALERSIQTQTDGEVYGQVGRVISGKVTFDSNGRLFTKGQPIYRNGTTIKFEDISSEPGTNRLTIWEYDALDRIKKINEPGNRITSMTYEISTHPRNSSMKTRMIKTIDPQGKIQFKHMNSRDILVAIVEILNGQDLITSYNYKSTGELIEIKDALNHVSKIEYDLAGRRTAVTAPDAGRLEFAYDFNGNLIEKTDQELCPQNNNLLESCSNNQKIRYEYDKNRLISVVYPNLPKVNFVYGDVSQGSECQGNNVQGRICKVEDGTIATYLAYGALGEVIEQKRIMKGAPWETEDRTFVTKYKYDSFGRMLSLVYPDGEELTYRYNNGGRVKSVTGQIGVETIDYVGDIHYDEFGMKTKVENGNGVITNYIYKPETHWLDIETIYSPTITNPLRSMEYNYDNVGNILTFSDIRSGDAPFFSKVERVYTYDDLYRLDDFTMTFHQTALTDNSPLIVNGSFEYDEVGNITNQVINRSQGTNTLSEYPTRDWQYIYNSNHPNLPEKIGPYSYNYDNRGSILSSTRLTGNEAPLGITYTWDDEGRLKTSKMETPASAPITEYIYNIDGQRLRKQTPALLTNLANDQVDASLYPNVYYTARFARTIDGNTTNTFSWDQIVSRSKHIYVDGQHIATTSMVVDPASMMSEDKLPILAKITRFFSNNTVASVGFLTDENGKISQEIDYFPFGEIISSKLVPNDPSLAHNFTFDGKELDSETGLQYFGFRYYDPRIARWISADPLYRISPDIGLVNPASLNLFAFGKNNPIQFHDYNGCDPETDIRLPSVTQKKSFDSPPVGRELHGINIGTPYASEKEAAAAALRDIYSESVKIDEEFIGWIYRVGKYYYYTAPRNLVKYPAVRKHKSIPVPISTVPGTVTAGYHTHGGPNPKYEGGSLSRRDMLRARRIGKNEYVATPSGDLLSYTRNNGNWTLRSYSEINFSRFNPLNAWKSIVDPIKIYNWNNPIPEPLRSFPLNGF